MKKMIGIFLILTLLISCSQPETEGTNQKTNLQVLDSLNEECTRLMHIYSPDLLRAGEELRDEGLKQKNDLFTGYGYRYMLYYYLNNIYTNNENVHDTIRYYGQKGAEYLNKAGESTIALHMEVNIIRWELYFTDNENTFTRLFDVLNKIKETDDNALKVNIYSIMGTAYNQANSPKEALNAQLKRLEFTRKLENIDTKRRTDLLLDAFNDLAITASAMGQYDSTLMYCDSMKFYLKQTPDIPNSKIWENRINLLSLKSLTEKNELEAAGPFAEKLQAYSDTIDEDMRSEHYYNIQLALAPYYREKKEYDKALKLVNEAISYYSTTSSHSANLNSAKVKKSEILTESGKNLEEALKLQKEGIAYSYNLAQENSTRQLNEMYTLYKVGNLEKQAIENESKAYHFQMISIIFIVACLFMIVIVIIIRLNYNKLRKKNEKLFEQYKEQDKYKIQINKLNSSITLKAPEILNEQSLFDKIDDYVTQSQCYKNPEISREFLAAQVGTNREYMTRAIQENINMTFTEYINHHRLEYARQLLIENIAFSVEYIYMSAGFNTKSTFYRLFKQKYDLTPKELRDIAIENSNQVTYRV